MENDIIQKSGAWFSYNDQRIGQGRDNARLYLENNPDVADEIDAKIREIYITNKGAPLAQQEDDVPEMPEGAEDEEY